VQTLVGDSGPLAKPSRLVHCIQFDLTTASADKSRLADSDFQMVKVIEERMIALPAHTIEGSR
jgi:hypothetical protein